MPHHQADELLRLSKNIGSGWKNVGNGLKFNWAQLDQFEADTKSVSEAVQRMLFRWLQWKDQKATVGRLTKVTTAIPPTSNFPLPPQSHSD